MPRKDGYLEQPPTELVLVGKTLPEAQRLMDLLGEATQRSSSCHVVGIDASNPLTLDGPCLVLLFWKAGEWQEELLERAMAQFPAGSVLFLVTETTEAHERSVLAQKQRVAGHVLLEDLKHSLPLVMDLAHQYLKIQSPLLAAG